MTERKVIDELLARVVPNPGSPEATKAGCCTCAVIDNHHGAGVPYHGEIAFWTTEGCPLHARAIQGQTGDCGWVM